MRRCSSCSQSTAPSSFVVWPKCAGRGCRVMFLMAGQMMRMDRATLGAQITFTSPHCTALTTRHRSIPITWLYMKNVAYHKFIHITQERNGQSVVNMWNGMHLDTEAGRRVIETYVLAPHFHSILVWPKSTHPENRHPYADAFTWQGGQSKNAGRGMGNNHPVANVRALRGGRGGPSGRGSYNAGGRDISAMNSDNWRKP